MTAPINPTPVDEPIDDAPDADVDQIGPDDIADSPEDPSPDQLVGDPVDDQSAFTGQDGGA